MVKSDSVAWDNKGLAENALGDHQGALPYFNKAITLDPQDEYAYYNKAEAFQKERQNACSKHLKHTREYSRRAFKQ